MHGATIKICNLNIITCQQLHLTTVQNSDIKFDKYSQTVLVGNMHRNGLLNSLITII